ASAEAHLGLGRVLLQGEPSGLSRRVLEQAAAELQEATRLNPGLADAHCALSAAQRQLGQAADAVTSARRAIQLSPDLADAFHYLGAALVEQEELAEAEAALREAVRLRPDQGPYHYNLSVTLRRQ